jgi:hypothetical protein
VASSAPHMPPRDMFTWHKWHPHTTRGLLCAVQEQSHMTWRAPASHYASCMVDPQVGMTSVCAKRLQLAYRPAIVMRGSPQQHTPSASHQHCHTGRHVQLTMPHHAHLSANIDHRTVPVPQCNKGAPQGLPPLLRAFTQQQRSWVALAAVTRCCCCWGSRCAAARLCCSQHCRRQRGRGVLPLHEGLLQTCLQAKERAENQAWLSRTVQYNTVQC